MGKIPTNGRTQNKNIADAIVKDLGIDTTSIAQEVVSGFIKEQVFGQKQRVTRNTKFGSCLNAVSDFIRSVWWVPAVTMFSLGLVTIILALTKSILGA